jgi:hypothetical protein
MLEEMRFKKDTDLKVIKQTVYDYVKSEFKEPITEKNKSPEPYKMKLTSIFYNKKLALIIKNKEQNIKIKKKIEITGVDVFGETVLDLTELNNVLKTQDKFFKRVKKYEDCKNEMVRMRELFKECLKRNKIKYKEYERSCFENDHISNGHYIVYTCNDLIEFKLEKDDFKYKLRYNNGYLCRYEMKVNFDTMNDVVKLFKRINDNYEKLQESDNRIVAGYRLQYYIYKTEEKYDEELVSKIRNCNKLCEKIIQLNAL